MALDHNAIMAELPRREVGDAFACNRIHRFDVSWGWATINLNPNWHQRLRIRARCYADRVADAWAVLRGNKVALTEDEAYF